MWPCHDDENQNCLFCYCPLSFLECCGDYEIIEKPIKRKDCTKCTLIHGADGYDHVIEMLRDPKIWKELLPDMCT